MNTTKFIIGTLVGGIAFFFLGFLIYGIALESFFTQHAGSATGLQKTMDDMQWWALIVGNLASAALLSYIFLKWANIKSFGEGASAGAVIGFFIALSYDMVSYATTNMMDITACLTDVVVGTVMTAIGGGIIGTVLGMGKS